LSNPEAKLSKNFKMHGCDCEVADCGTRALENITLLLAQVHELAEHRLRTGGTLPDLVGEAFTCLHHVAMDLQVRAKVAQVKGVCSPESLAALEAIAEKEMGGGKNDRKAH
jgi:hypothetical protein